MLPERAQSADTAALSAIRSELAGRVRARAPEIEQELIARIRASVDADLSSEFLADLQAAARESIEYAMGAVEEGEAWTPAVPPTVAAQIRLLASGGATLEKTLEGYSTVHGVLMEFLTEEMGSIPPGPLGHMLKVQSQQSDKLMMAFTAEYTNEVARLNRSSAEHLADRVRRLLAEDTAETAELGYELDAWHFGVIVLGAKGDLIVRRLAERLGRSLLVVTRGPELVWAWLGGQRSIAVSDFTRLAFSNLDPPLRFAFGEARKGVDGWRQTHREAQIALSVMLRGEQSMVRCADVILPAAIMREAAMSGFLLDAYLAPLEELKDAEALKRTLRSYLSSGCNTASTAASLGVDRHTVQRRLRRVEERLQRPLDSCRAELEVALQVEALRA